MHGRSSTQPRSSAARSHCESDRDGEPSSDAHCRAILRLVGAVRLDSRNDGRPGDDPAVSEKSKAKNNKKAQRKKGAKTKSLKKSEVHELHALLKDACKLSGKLGELYAQSVDVCTQLESVRAKGQAELSAAKQELEGLHSQLESVSAKGQAELSAAKQELEGLHSQLESVQAELSSARQELEGLHSQLDVSSQPRKVLQPTVPAPNDDDVKCPVTMLPESLMQDGPEIVTATEPETSAVGRRRSVASGGVILWGGTIAFGVSTALLLAVLSRHHAVGLAALSALLGLSFVISLIPSGVQLRAAALVADGLAIPRVSARFLGTITVIGIAFSPVLSLVLRVPVLAVALVVAQLVLALPLAARRGALIGVHRFAALGCNMVIEGGVRIALGVLGGLLLGITGVAGALALATGVALVTLPTSPPESEAVRRPMTSLFNASITLVLLGFFVQMDVLMAPSGLTHAGATYYDLAAIPSKGVYFVLAAAGPMVFPFVRRNASPHLIIYAAVGTLAFGLAVTVVLLPFRQVVGIVLGQPSPSLLLIVLLGSAMAGAATTTVLLNAGVARGVARPWPPLVLGMVAVTACWATRPSATIFALTFLAAQSVAMLLSAWVALMGQRGTLTSLSAVVSDEEALGAVASIVTPDTTVAATRSQLPDSRPEDTTTRPSSWSRRHPSSWSQSLADRRSRANDREGQKPEKEAVDRQADTG